VTRAPLTANALEIQARLRAGQPLAHIRAIAAYRGWSADDFTAARDWAAPDVELKKLFPNGRRPLPREHGTRRGFWQHKSNAEQPCEECKEARNAYDREWKRAQKAKAS
jgi:hypothetical protein